MHPRDNGVGTQSSVSVVYRSVLPGVLTLIAVSMWAFFFVYNRRHEKREEAVPVEA